MQTRKIEIVLHVGGLYAEPRMEPLFGCVASFWSQCGILTLGILPGVAGEEKEGCR